jgi:hypothetical protein
MCLELSSAAQNLRRSNLPCNKLSLSGAGERMPLMGEVFLEKSIKGQMSVGVQEEYRFPFPDLGHVSITSHKIYYVNQKEGIGNGEFLNGREFFPPPSTIKFSIEVGKEINLRLPVQDDCPSDRAKPGAIRRIPEPPENRSGWPAEKLPPGLPREFDHPEGGLPL